MLNGEEFLGNGAELENNGAESSDGTITAEDSNLGNDMAQDFNVSQEELAYIENGFIVDVTDAKKISDVIYQLSTVLDLPEAQEKLICIKLGDIDLNASQLSSIRALVETMNSQVAFISTTSDITETSAYEIGMKVSKLENKIVTPDFESNTDGSVELEKALDKIFGGVSNEAMKLKEKLSQIARPIEKVVKTAAEDLETAEEIVSQENLAPELSEIKVSADEDSEDFSEYSALNKELEDANNISAEEEERLRRELEAKLQLTEKLPTLYIQRTLRSGQTLTADGNIVIVGDVNPGSEIKAVGDITVWGILGGIAHAGIEGNQFAKIRALKMNAIQLRIGEVFARRPDSANIPYIQKTDTFVPEEASVDGNHIIIQKMINR